MEHKLLPKLRFKEFVNDEEWKEKSLEELADVIASGDLDVSSFSSVKTDEHIFPIYSNSISKDGLYGYSLLPRYKKDTVTITARGTLGVAFERKEDFVGIGRLLVIQNFVRTVPYFFKENWNNYAKVPLENGGIPQLTAVKAKSIKLLFPNPKEQQKIADCLSSLDDLINAENEKLDALKEHKKGLMQQLFPADGEKVPKLRFPEFKDSGEWEKKKLGDKTQLLSGYAFKSIEISDNPEGIKLVRGINVTEGIIRHSKDIDRYFLGDTEKLEKYRVEKNDLLIAMDGSKVGKNTALVSQDDIGGLLVQRVARLRTDSESSIKYVFHHVNSISFHNYVDKINTSSGIPHISAEQIKNFQIPFPPLNSELEKIEGFMTSLNDIIILQKNKIEDLKIHKQGLMQGLFPIIN